MKITKSELQQIIKEEVSRVLSEGNDLTPYFYNDDIYAYISFDPSLSVEDVEGILAELDITPTNDPEGEAAYEDDGNIVYDLEKEDWITAEAFVRKEGLGQAEER